MLKTARSAGEPDLYEDNQYSDRPSQSAQEPVAHIFLHPLGKLFYHVVDDSCAGHNGVIPVYAFPTDEMTATGLFFGIVLLLIFGATTSVTLWLVHKVYKFFGGQ